MIRRRIQNLPRGLRQPAGEQEEEPEPPPGVQLVPPSAPSDIFRPEEPEEDEEDEEPPGSSLVLVTGEEPAVGAAAPAAAESGPAVRLRLVPAPPSVAPGESFTVALEVDASRPVSHLPVTLRYDPRLLEVEAVEEGDFLGDETVAKILAAAKPGRMILGASRLGEVAGVVGSGVLARVRFRALAEGEAVVAFEKGKALGPGLEPLRPLVTEPARVVVTRAPAPAPPPRPEPTRPAPPQRPRPPRPDPVP